MCVCVFQAYSLVDREVGYCQGSAFIVGLLLMQVMLKYFMIYNELFFPLKVQHMMSELCCHQSHEINTAGQFSCLLRLSIIYGSHCVISCST